MKIILAFLVIFTIGAQEHTVTQYQKQLATDPFNTTILSKLANAYLEDGQLAEATYCYQKLMGKNPYDQSALYNLGWIHTKNNHLAQAVDYFTKLITINPNHIKAYLERAKLFEQQKKFDSAIKDYRQITDLDPYCISAYQRLALVLKNNEAYQEAIETYKRLIALNPAQAWARFQLSIIYIMVGESEAAVKELEKILEEDPNNYRIMHNIAYSLKVAGRVDEAINMYKQAIELNPQYEASVYALALAYLYKGDFAQGWKQYSWRLKKEKRNAEQLRKWIKENKVQNKKIFLMPEGGLGDTIQFIRYAELLKQMGADLTVMVPKPLKPLLSSCPYIDNLIVLGEPFDRNWQDRASIMSLPAIFESEEENIPRNIPYIYPDKALVEKWRSYFEGENNFKIGLCWEADVKNDASRVPAARRSIPLIKLEKLTNLKNVTFYSLQKSNGTSELADLPEHFVVNRFGPDFDETAGPFMDTAAIINHLDLIITVDTSIAHLAGALGKPVWVMLPHNTDWRWIVNRTDSPWYPTMKIFKQSIPFDWDTIIADIFEVLKTQLGQ